MLKIAIYMLCLFSLSFAEKIEIKSLKIGLTKKEVSKLYDIGDAWGPKRDTYYPKNKKGDKEITIAGYTTFVALEFRGDKIDDITFSFKSSYFHDILEVIKGKYSNLRCYDSDVKNKLGNTFIQTKCILEDDTSTIYIQKLSNSNISSSYININSQKRMEEINKKHADSKKDI